MRGNLEKQFTDFSNLHFKVDPVNYNTHSPLPLFFILKIPFIKCFWKEYISQNPHSAQCWWVTN